MRSPKIRFSQPSGVPFENWRLAKIKDLCFITKESINPKTNPDKTFVEYSMPAFDNCRIPYLRKGKELESLRLAINGDVILFNKLNIKKMRIWNVKNATANSLCSSEFLPLTVKEGFCQDFAFYYLSTKRFTSKLNGKSSGTSNSQKRIRSEDLLNEEIIFPCLMEQQKIAAFFSTLDEKISLSERKLEALEKLKKGLMQKIFSQSLRFKAKDGHDFDDWKTFKIDDVAFIRGGGTPSTKNEYYWNGNIQWMTPTEINSKYVHKSLRTITKLGLDNSSAKLLPKGAILLTTRATIGACSINNFDGDVCTNQGFQSLICKQNIIPEFLYYSITNPVFQKEMQKNASGSTFLEISSANLKKLTLQVPSIEEQESISTFLSVFDEKIDLIKTKICALKQLKQGFMQQMFV